MSSRDLDLGQDLSDHLARALPHPTKLPNRQRVVTILQCRGAMGRAQFHPAPAGQGHPTTVIRAEILDSPCFSPSDPVSLGRPTASILKRDHAPEPLLPADP